MPSPDLNPLARFTENQLLKNNVHLTMGGEPTYVPIQPSHPSWNTKALSDEKFDYAKNFITHLVSKHLPGALIMQTFGKHCPGEALPRWNLLALHRRNNQPLWKDPSKLAFFSHSNASSQDTHTLLQSLIKKLKLNKTSPIPTNQNSGYILPLTYKKNRWISPSWPFETIQPIPGDSPVGLRLPLEDLPPDTPITALTLEATNDNNLQLFIPPLPLEAFYTLIPIIESLSCHNLTICGYAPGFHPDFHRLGLTPDPGVLEVNLPLCHTWDEYAYWLDIIDNVAQHTKLRSYKFNYNGQPLSTGGGSHLSFGGPTPQTSPLLTNKKLLSSIIRYWQHHPALSYLFTGYSIGQSSQAPRIDETNTHSLSEIELACQGIENIKSPFNSEFIDHLFSNLLTDASGNAHRSEICIDKLWNNQAPNGKMGIVEFRALDSFPSTDSLKLIALLFRSILAYLIDHPFQKSLHSHALNDLYLLPSVLKHDLAQILQDLAHAGYDFQLSWFDPIFEFRFPTLGTLNIPDGKIIFRQALEPWPLIPEKSGGMGASRDIDSSMDRLEATLEFPHLHTQGYLYIHGSPLSLQPFQDTYLAGIRYKTFDAYPARQPHIAAHTPLLIEWVSHTTQSVQAAAYYYHWNPNNQDYSNRPTTWEDAHTRSQARWIPTNETLGQTRPPLEKTLDNQYTHDLRCQG